jgi:hypothetical protein
MSTTKPAKRKRKTETVDSPAIPTPPAPPTPPMSEVSRNASNTMLSMFTQETIDAKRQQALTLRDLFALDDQPLLSAIANQFAEGFAFLMGRHNELYHLVQQAEGASHAD